MPNGTIKRVLVDYKFNLSGAFRSLSDLRSELGSLSEDGVARADCVAAISSRSSSVEGAPVTVSPGSDGSKIAAGTSCDTPSWMSNGSELRRRTRSRWRLKTRPSSVSDIITSLLRSRRIAGIHFGAYCVWLLTKMLSPGWKHRTFDFLF